MMFHDVSKRPPPLPSPELVELTTGISLLPPLSRRGHGPGLIILTPDNSDPLAIKEGVPSPLVKWAEEGYAVVKIQASALGDGKQHVLKVAIEALSKCVKCEPKNKVGLVSYEPELWNQVAPAVSALPEIVAAAVYADASQVSPTPRLAAASIPVVYHLAGKGTATSKKTDLLTEYYYPNVASFKFATPFQSSFQYTTEALSHTRNLMLLKGKMGCPLFDLETIWDEHTYYEFADRSVEHTMSTMVQEPYVNHVPTMTGGIGREALTHFYAHNFIFNNSADTELELTSRTVGIDRVIDEFIFKFTHDRELDWLLPGVPPTGVKAEVPFTAVVNIRGDRLYHEHIAWDQGTVLRQLGLLPEYLQFPYPLPNSKSAAPGKTIEYRVPVEGVATADKMRDRNSVSSNQMFEYKIREV